MCYQLTPLQSRHGGFVSPLQFRLGRKVGACPRGLHAPCALHPPSTQARLLSGPALWCARAHLRGPFSTSRAEVPKGPVRSLPSRGGVGTLPCLLPPLHAPWLGPGRLGPGETRARPALSVCPPGRVASVCLGCWLLPAQARGLDALYREPSAPQGPMLALGPPPSSAPAARRPEAPQRPQAEAKTCLWCPALCVRGRRPGQDSPRLSARFWSLTGKRSQPALHTQEREQSRLTCVGGTFAPLGGKETRGPLPS